MSFQTNCEFFCEKFEKNLNSEKIKNIWILIFQKNVSIVLKAIFINFWGKEICRS